MKNRKKCNYADKFDINEFGMVVLSLLIKKQIGGLL